MRISIVANALFVSAAFWAGTAFAAQQEIVFAPSFATAEGVIEIQGRISRAPVSLKRKALIDTFPLNIKPDPDRKAPLFRERAGQFWSDSDMIESVSIKIGSSVHRLPSTDSGGYFSVTVPLTSAETAQLKADGRLPFESVATAKTPGISLGEVLLVPEVGLTVITDIDDTIKLTNVASKAERDANTFVRPFKAVPFMPDLYTMWQQKYGQAIHFHVVSAGPWQLHEPLRKFAKDAGFPPFTWHMRSMKMTDFASLEEALDPDRAAQIRQDFKIKAIRSFMLRFEQRHVILVGDSGEQDPEVYSAILSEFPERVDWILIRDVSNDPKFEKRGRAARFAAPERASKLRVFSDPNELSSLLR